MSKYKKKKHNREEIINFLEEIMKYRRERYYQAKEEGDKKTMEEMDTIIRELYGILYAIK